MTYSLKNAEGTSRNHNGRNRKLNYKSILRKGWKEKRFPSKAERQKVRLQE